MSLFFEINNATNNAINIETIVNNIFNYLKEGKEYIFYFKINNKKANRYICSSNDSCKLLIAIGNDKYVRFTWNHVKLFGDNDIHKQANLLRKTIVTQIKNNIQENNQLKVEDVGTNINDANITSDVDLNVIQFLHSCGDNCDVTEEEIYKKMLSVTENNIKIILVSKKYLEECFEINLYPYNKTGVENKCKETHVKSESNRRIIDITEKHGLKDIFDVIYGENSMLVKSIIPKIKCNSEESLCDYCITDDDDIPTLVSNNSGDMLSLRSTSSTFLGTSSYASFVTDVYYSIGALCHIVEKQQNLAPEYYIDSLVDNLGFLMYYLFDDHDNNYCKCIGPIHLYTRLAKVCKYLTRMCNAVELIFKKINTLDKILQELDIILNKKDSDKIDFLSNAGIGYDEVGKKYKLATIYNDIVTLYKYNNSHELNKDNGIYTNLKHLVNLYNESKISNHLLNNVVYISQDKYIELKDLATKVNDIRKSNYNSDILDTIKSTYDYMDNFDNGQKDIDSVGSYTVPDNWLWRILNFFKPFLDIYCEIYKDTNSKKIELSACKIQGGKISRNNKISNVFIRKQKFSDGVTRNIYRIGTSNYANYKKKLIKVRTLKKFLKRMKK